MSKGPSPGDEMILASVEPEAGLAEALDDARHEVGELQVAADQDPAAALEVGLAAEQFRHLELRLRQAPEVAQAAGPHQRPPEEGDVPEQERPLVRALVVADAQVVRPERVLRDRQSVRIALRRAPDQVDASLPLA